MSEPRVYLVAAEPSGDLLARETAEALKAQAPDIHIDGIGGHELAKIGITFRSILRHFPFLGCSRG